MHAGTQRCGVFELGALARTRNEEATWSFPRRATLTGSRALLAWLIVCYAFLYAPIGFLIAFSFNASRLVTAWSGASLRWYVTLAHDPQLIGAALLSLSIATASATLALIVGTLAGYALARF